MSTLKLDTLSNKAGTASVPSDTIVSGTAKAWVNFNGTGTVAIRRAFNVSSITDRGTGAYTVNFTNAMSDTNYVPVFFMEGGFDVQRYQTGRTQYATGFEVDTGFHTTSSTLVQADIGTIGAAIFS